MGKIRLQGQTGGEITEDLEHSQLSFFFFFKDLEASGGSRRQDQT